MGYHQGLQIVSFMQDSMISLYYESRMKLYMFNESLSSWANCIKSKQEEKRSLSTVDTMECCATQSTVT